MGSLSGEDASAGMTTTGLMCSDSAEARKKLGGFWRGRTARPEGVSPVLHTAIGTVALGAGHHVLFRKLFPSSFLPALLPQGGILEPSPRDVGREQLHPPVTDSGRMQG